MSPYDAIPDHVLATKLVAGDESAFAMTYLKYKKPLYGFVKKFVHSEELANDLAQEAFIKLWESRSKLDNVRSLKAYLFTIAKNHTLNNLKKVLQSDTAMPEIIRRFKESSNSVEEQLLNKEYEAYLKKILNDLPERTRQIFIQCRDQGRTYEEVAQEMGISRDAVKKHMVNAMKYLSTSVKRDLGISLSVLLALLLDQK